jgi:Protein of unknown function (DUF5818)
MYPDITLNMSGVGTSVDESGTLLHESAGYVLRRDAGGRWKLDMHRVQTDYVKKRVRITGVIVADGMVDVNGISAEP